MTAVATATDVRQLLASYVDCSQPGQIRLPWTRNRLAEFFAECGYTKGAEIGVERGKFSEVLCQANPGLRLYAVDPWARIPGYRTHVTQSELDDFHRETERRLAPYDARIIRDSSVFEVQRHAPHSLDFVFIDGAHDLASVVHDIVNWSVRVRPGGIVSGHDFQLRTNGDICHVQHAVEAYVKSYGIAQWFVLTGDRSPSWFWVQR